MIPLCAEGNHEVPKCHLKLKGAGTMYATIKDIPGYLAKATYLGWRPVAEGKHYESAYFAYFSRELGCRTILCMRKMADGNIYKPYAIIDEHTFKVGIEELRK